MQDILVEFLEKRKNRSIAIIMSWKERECDSQLDPATRQNLRKVILDQINEFHDSCIDVMSSLDTNGVVLNEEYLEKLDELHRVIMKNELSHGR